MKNFGFFDNVRSLRQGLKIGGVQTEIRFDVFCIKVWSMARSNVTELQITRFTELIKLVILNKE